MYYDLNKDVFRKRLILEASYKKKIKNKGEEKLINDFLLDLAKSLKMKTINGPFISSATGNAKPIHEGYEGQVVWAESGADIYVWTKYNFLTVDIYSCKDFNTEKTINFIKKYFDIKDFTYKETPDELYRKFENKIELKSTKVKGSGIFAKEEIKKGDILSYVDGQIYFSKKESQINSLVKDHAIPFSKYFYRNSFNSLSVKFNHSCDPNCYIKDLFFVTAMRDIKKGEELTMSYSLFCNSDWQNPEGKCFCKSKKCYGKIVPWRDLTKEDKEKYIPFTADWILFEEMKKNGYLDNLKNSLK